MAQNVVEPYLGSREKRKLVNRLCDSDKSVADLPLRSFCKHANKRLSPSSILFAARCDMTDPSLLIRYGDFQASAVGLSAIIALVVLILALAISAR